jgi:two-component system, sensor histidine kinase and response regulator
MEGDGARRTVLVVDDDASNRLAMAALLEPLDFRVVLARSGEEAIELAKQECFAVILVDVRMPRLDGFETVARLREEANSRRTPVVLLSAFGSSRDYARKAYAVGAVDYITKPVDGELLRAKVASLADVWLTERQPGSDETSRGAIAAYFRAERANLLKDRLVGILGHDLRDPLACIIMNARVMGRSEELPQRFAVMTARILRSAERMTEMVGEILDFTRAELGGGLAITRQPVDMGDICRGVVDESESAHPHRQVRLECSGELRGLWDHSRATQAIANLVANAIKHSSTDVVVKVDGRGTELRVSVHNGGEPIPASELPSLFEPFRQGKSPGSCDGLGLGLYIVREIVGAHGGRVEAISSAAEGTTFLTVWPRTPPVASMRPPMDLHP